MKKGSRGMFQIKLMGESYLENLRKGIHLELLLSRELKKYLLNDTGTGRGKI